MSLKKEHDYKFRYIDLFAGIGGLRLPFQELGGMCVFTSEWDKFAQKTYLENFHETPSGDITKIHPQDIPNHDLLLAGFPCQPFSNAGLKQGFLETRGTLFFNIEQIIEAKRPKAVLLENVMGLKSHDGGRTFNVITKKLERLGYGIYSHILNAKDFGVPQNRRRIFIVAFNRNQLGDVIFEFPEPLRKRVAVGDILEKCVNPKYTISDRLWAGHKRRKIAHAVKGNGFGFSLYSSKSPYTSTISARYYKDGSEILIGQKGKNPRKLTPREAARLQGFPENFRIPVSDVQAYKQFGNSVAVPVIRAIAKRLVTHLNGTGIHISPQHNIAS